MSPPSTPACLNQKPVSYWYTHEAVAGIVAGGLHTTKIRVSKPHHTNAALLRQHAAASPAECL